MMKVVQLQHGFGINRLQLAEVPKPNPAPGEVLVKLEAASLNYVDLLVVKGLLNPNLTLPYVPVTDGAGVVEQVGAGVTTFQVGDRVATTFIPQWLGGRPTANTTDYITRQGLGQIPGQLAEYKCFQVNELIHCPTNLSTIEASTLPIAGLTAWNALRTANLQAGETVLLHGTGGVAIFALQFAKALGANVIMTSSHDAKLKRAEQLGADFLINYKTTADWEAVVRQVTNGNGADVVVETVGGANLQRSLNAVRMGGYIAVVGLLDGFESTVNTLNLLHQQATVRGMEVGSTADFAAMNQAITAHGIHPVIDAKFTLEETQTAFRYLEQGQHFGKVVITF
jgi:NADPH:quinone reductase-like Zn-dependent oxidoreductase